MEQVVSSLDFWPGLLEKLRAAVKFLRVDSYRSRVIQRAEALDCAAHYLEAKPPSFANWRWDTLADVSC